MNARGTYRKGSAETTGEQAIVPDHGAAAREPDETATCSASAAIMKRSSRSHGARAHPGNDAETTLPLAAPTFENRLRMRSSSPSQTSR